MDQSDNSSLKNQRRSQKLWVQSQFVLVDSFSLTYNFGEREKIQGKTNKNRNIERANCELGNLKHFVNRRNKASLNTFRSV